MPLMCACVSYGNTENIQFLVEKGANLYARDFDDVSALTLALHFGDQKMVDFLCDNGLSPTPSPASRVGDYSVKSHKLLITSCFLNPVQGVLSIWEVVHLKNASRMRKKHKN